MITEQERTDVLARAAAVVDLSNRMDTARHNRDADARAAVRALLRGDVDQAQRYAADFASGEVEVDRLFAELKALPK